jgi:hypothetical protein
MHGPFSAFEISKYSQINRIKNLLSNKKQEKQNSFDINAFQEIQSIVDYLLDNYGITSLQPFTPINLDTLEINLMDKQVSLRDTAMAILGLSKSIYQFQDNVEYPEYWIEGGLKVDISGYDKLEFIHDYYKFDKSNELISYDPKKNILYFKDGSDTAKLDFNPILQKILNDSKSKNKPDQELSITYNGKKINVKVIFHRLNFKYSGEGISDVNFSFVWLTKQKHNNK